MDKRIPVTVITGFLGSGKTTLLRQLLKTTDQRLAVMVNEFGSVGLDGDLIRSCGFCSEDEIQGRLVELNNGCLCCTVQDDFLPSIELLLNCPYQLDGIVIETSGLALPRPLLQAINWPEIKTKVFLNGVITLVDGEALSNGSPVADILSLEKQRAEDKSLDHSTPVDELFFNQLQYADLILISRADVISTSSLNQIRNDLSNQVRKGTSILFLSHGNIDSNLVLGIHHASNRQSDEHETEIDEHDHDHQHVEAFTITIQLKGLINKQSLESILPQLALRYQIVRLKGRCWFPEKGLPLQIQMVGPRINSWFEEAPPTVWRPENGGLDFVVITFQADAAESIKNNLQECLII